MFSNFINSLNYRASLGAHLCGHCLPCCFLFHAEGTVEQQQGRDLLVAFCARWLMLRNSVPLKNGSYFCDSLQSMAGWVWLL